MEKAEVLAVVSAAIDSVGCDDCRRLFGDLIAAYAINDAGELNARELGKKVSAGEITPAFAYDALAAAMHPVYAAAGAAVPEERNSEIREAFLKVANSGLN